MDENATTNTNRFDKIDHRLDVLSTQLDTKFGNIDDKFDKIDQRFDALDTQLEKKFSSIDRKFDKIDGLFTKTESQFNKLTAYMLRRFDRVDKKLDEKANKVDMQRALGLLDSLAKRQEISDEERLVEGYQLVRLDRWTHELAKKVGHKLTA